MITPIEMTHAYEIQWFINNESVSLENVFSIASLNLPVGDHSLRVEVVDPTTWVRNETARESIMKQSVAWPVIIDEIDCPEDINGDGIVNISDLLAIISDWGVCDGCTSDLNGDGDVNVTDLLQVIEHWGSCSL